SYISKLFPYTTLFRSLTIDYYAGYYVINWYSEGIYAYKTDIVQTLEQLSDCQAIYEKKRFKQKGSYIDDDDFVSGTRADFPLIRSEEHTSELQSRFDL